MGWFYLKVGVLLSLSVAGGYLFFTNLAPIGQEVEKLYKLCKRAYRKAFPKAVIRAKPKSEDPFQDYEWLPNYKKDFDHCEEFHDVSSKDMGLCYWVMDPDSLMSAKIEMISEEPLVVLFHSAITDENIEDIIETSEEELKESEVLAGVDLETSKKDPSRVAMMAWLYNGMSKLDQVKWFYMQITGIELEYAEAMNVIHYSPGGHYAPHFDSLNVSEDMPHPDGDRIVTLLTFFNEPEDGGSTVFPELGFAVKPSKGSMLLWFNLMTNGEQDPRTLHGGCPVWQGIKQIGTLWVREKGNELIVKCPVAWGFDKGSFQKGLIRFIP